MSETGVAIVFLMAVGIITVILIFEQIDKLIDRVKELESQYLKK